MEPIPHLLKCILHSLRINYDLLESEEAIDYFEYNFIIDMEVFHVNVNVILLDLGRFYRCVKHIEDNALQNYLLVALEVIDPDLSFFTYFNSYIICDLICSFSSCSC